MYYLHEFQVDGLLEAFCEDANITVDEAIQGIGRLNKITDLREIFNVSDDTRCTSIVMFSSILLFGIQNGQLQPQDT